MDDKELFVSMRPVEIVYLRLMRAVALGLRAVQIRLRADQIDILEASPDPDDQTGGWLASIWAESDSPDSVGLFVEDGLRHVAAVGTERLVDTIRELCTQDGASIVEALNKVCDEPGEGDD